MHKDRLLKLADFLETLPKEKFDISRWKNTCGTVACAIGWAVTIPEFQELGLKMFGEPNKHATGSYSEYWYPVYQEYDGFWAAAKFFGITYEESCDLFCGIYYEKDYEKGYCDISPTDVSLKIRDFVRNGDV